MGKLQKHSPMYYIKIDFTDIILDTHSTEYNGQAFYIIHRVL